MSRLFRLRKRGRIPERRVPRPCCLKINFKNFSGEPAFSRSGESVRGPRFSLRRNGGMRWTVRRHAWRRAGRSAGTSSAVTRESRRGRAGHGPLSPQGPVPPDFSCKFLCRNTVEENMLKEQEMKRGAAEGAMPMQTCRAQAPEGARPPGKVRNRPDARSVREGPPEKRNTSGASEVVGALRGRRPALRRAGAAAFSAVVAAFLPRFL